MLRILSMLAYFVLGAAGGLLIANGYLLTGVSCFIMIFLIAMMYNRHKGLDANTVQHKGEN